MQNSIIPTECTGDFEHERWLEVTQPLRRHASALVDLAAARRLVFTASARWPEIGLQRRSLLFVYEARLSLIPETSNGAGQAWAVRVVRYPRWPMLMPRSEAVTDVAILSQHEVDDRQRLLSELTKALDVMQAMPN